MTKRNCSVIPPQYFVDLIVAKSRVGVQNRRSYGKYFFLTITIIFFFSSVAFSQEGALNRFVRDSIQELDLLDQASVELLSGKSELFPDITEIERKEKVSEIELALKSGLTRAYSEVRLTNAELAILAGLHVNYLQRRALDNKPLKTQIKSLLSRQECKQDLALGRAIVRYTRALAKRDDGEQFLVLMDYQNALNCISGLQARLLAHATGVALWEWLDRLEGLGLSENAMEVSIASVLNSTLMLFDISKYQGSNWLYYSLHRALSISPDASDSLSQLYLYDFITGSLVSFFPKGSISIGPLLDPSNIGTGICSLVEMIGAGNDSGDFACGRGLSCSASSTIESIDFPITEELLNQNNPLRNASDSSLFNEQSPALSNATDNILGETTAYGVPVSTLRGNCEGAGTSSAGIGQLTSSPGLASFSGCLSAALATAAQDNVASCKLSAGQAIAAEQTTTILGVGSNGLPVVRGLLGGASCRSDPLAQGGARQPVSGDPEFDCQTVFECGKEEAAEFYRSQAGLEFTKQLLHDAADAWADELRSLDSVAGGDGELSPSAQAAVDAAHQEADARAGELAEAGANSIESSEQKTGLASDQKDAGQTRGSDIVVDKGLPDTNSNQSVLEHEAAHVVLNLFFSDKGGSSRVDHHDLMKQQSDTYYDRWAEMMVDAKDWIVEQLSDEEDEDQNEQPENQDQTQTPRPDEEYCPAMTEGMKSFLACTNPIDLPFGVPGNINSDTVTLPEQADDLTFLTPLPDEGGFAESEAAASSMFSQCYEQFGMTVLGIDGNGQLIIGSSPDLGASHCGALDCIPPSVPKSVNGQCRCVGEGPDVSRIYREMGFLRLCATSDFCIPRDDFLPAFEDALEQGSGF